MAITKDQVQEFAKLIADLHEQILLNDFPEDSAYRGNLDHDTPFGLDDLGYRTSYRGGRVCSDSLMLFISDKLSSVHAAISWASVAQ